MTGLGGGWRPSVRLRSGWTPRVHGRVSRNAVWIILKKKVSYRNSSCRDMSLELSALCRAMAPWWESTCEKLPILPKSRIFTVVSNVLAVLPLPPPAPSPAASFAPAAVWPRTVGWLWGCREPCSSATSPRRELSRCGKEREKGQAFFGSVRFLLGVSSGEREGRDEAVRTVQANAWLFTVSGKMMVWEYIS